VGVVCCRRFTSNHRERRDRKKPGGWGGKRTWRKAGREGGRGEKKRGETGFHKKIDGEIVPEGKKNWKMKKGRYWIGSRREFGKKKRKVKGSRAP